MPYQSYKKEGHLTTYKMKLLTLSPVFIGGGEGVARLKSEQDFREKIVKNKNDIDNWVNFFTDPTRKEGETVNLTHYLGKNPHPDFKPNSHRDDFISEAGNYFIPGSSIKGAILTAIMADKKKKTIALNDDMQTIRQHIQVSDSNIIEEKHFLKNRQIQSKKIIHDYGLGDHTEKMKKTCLKANVDVIFYLTLDNELDIDYIMTCLANHYTNRVYKENEADLQEANEGGVEKTVKLGLKFKINGISCEPNINIGGQSGFNTKVVLSAFSNYQQTKKDVLSKAFRNHSHDRMPKAPRYLKFIEYDEKIPTGQGNEKRMETKERILTLGWCNLSVC